MSDSHPSRTTCHPPRSNIQTRYLRLLDVHFFLSFFLVFLFFVPQTVFDLWRFFFRVNHRLEETGCEERNLTAERLWSGVTVRHHATVTDSARPLFSANEMLVRLTSSSFPRLASPRNVIIKNFGSNRNWHSIGCERCLTVNLNANLVRETPHALLKAVDDEAEAATESSRCLCARLLVHYASADSSLLVDAPLRSALHSTRLDSVLSSPSGI